MSKLKTRVLGLIAAAAMLLALLAPSLFFLPRFASAEESAGEATAVMVDPTYQMISERKPDPLGRVWRKGKFQCVGQCVRLYRRRRRFPRI